MIYSLILFLSLSTQNVSGDSVEAEFAKGQFLVKLKESEAQFSTSLNSLFEKHSVYSFEPLLSQVTSSRIYLVKLAVESDVNTAVDDFARNPMVEFAQPDSFLKISSSSQKKFLPAPSISPAPPVTPWPNDPFFHSSNSWGQGYDDLWGLKKIEAKQAWMQAGMGDDVVVAVIDSGLDYQHPDIATNVWQNRGERPNPDGQDNDFNGFIDDRIGYDFTTCNQFDNSGVCIDPKLPDADPLDDHGHGTHVSGTIAAVGNNKLGVIGVAPRAKIMPLKAHNKQGVGLTSELAQAIYYAAWNGADVLSNSWGCAIYPYFRCMRNPVLEDAVKTAYGLGAVVVFAAGNYHGDASYVSPQNLPETITVASSNYSDQATDFSNYGAEIDFAAPGGEGGSLSCSNVLAPNILSLRANETNMYAACGTQMIEEDNYLRAQGTSMAAPHVAGAAAVLLAAHPEWTQEEVRQALRFAANDIDSPGVDSNTGSGRLNIGKAAAISSVLRVQIAEPRSSEDFNNIDGQVWVSGTATGIDFSHYSLSFSPESPANSWSEIISNVSQDVENDFLGYWPISDLVTGNYLLRLTAQTNDGRIFEDRVKVFIERDVTQIGSSTNWGTSPEIWENSIVWHESNGSGASYGIHLYDFETNTESVLSTGNDYNPKIWGNHVVWMRQQIINFSPRNNFFLLDLSTGVLTQLSDNDNFKGYQTIWENWLAWRESRNGVYGIYLYNLQTHQEQLVTTTYFAGGSLAISDGKLVYDDRRWNNNDDIYMYNIATGVEQRITFNSSSQKHPHISGNRIVYSTSTSSGTDVYAYNLTTNQEQPIAVASGYQHSARVYGDRVVWRDGRNPTPDIRLYDFATQQTSILTSYLYPAAPQNPQGGGISVWVDYTGDPRIFQNKTAWVAYRNGIHKVFYKEMP